MMTYKQSELLEEIKQLRVRVEEFKRCEILLRNEVEDLNTTLSQMRIAADAWLIERDQLRARVEEFPSPNKTSKTHQKNV